MTEANDFEIEFWMKAYPELTKDEIQAIIDIIDESDDLQTVIKHIN